VFFSIAGSPAAQPASNSGLRLSSGTGLLAIGLLLGIQPLWRCRSRVTSAPAEDLQPASSGPRS
jgi:hypothetical protein